MSGTDAGAEGVRNCLATAAIATDRMDAELLASCYEPDATLDLGAFFRGTIAEYLAANTAPEGWPALDRTLHALTTSLVEVRGTEAVAESYCTCYHSGPPGHPWCDGFVVIHLRFLDELTHRDGRWRIRSRRGVFEWSRREPGTEAMPIPPGSSGRRDRSDPRYLYFPG